MNNDTPTTVVGSGFIPGVPGIFGNTTIPAPTPPSDATDASAPTPDQPVQPTADNAPQG